MRIFLQKQVKTVTYKYFQYDFLRYKIYILYFYAKVAFMTSLVVRKSMQWVMVMFPK